MQLEICSCRREQHDWADGGLGRASISMLKTIQKEVKVVQDKATSRKIFGGEKSSKTGRALKTGFRLVLAYCCLMVGLTQASRLSQWSEGTLVYQNPAAIITPHHGKITRDFRTGDYQVFEANGTLHTVRQDEVKEVASKATGITYQGMLSATLGLAMAMLCLIRNPFRFRLNRSN